MVLSEMHSQISSTDAAEACLHAAVLHCVALACALCCGASQAVHTRPCPLMQVDSESMAGSFACSFGIVQQMLEKCRTYRPMHAVDGLPPNRLV